MGFNVLPLSSSFLRRLTRPPVSDRAFCDRHQWCFLSIPRVWPEHSSPWSKTARAATWCGANRCSQTSKPCRSWSRKFRISSKNKAFPLLPPSSTASTIASAYLSGSVLSVDVRTFDQHERGETGSDFVLDLLYYVDCDHQHATAHKERALYDPWRADCRSYAASVAHTLLPKWGLTRIVRDRQPVRAGFLVFGACYTRIPCSADHIAISRFLRRSFAHSVLLPLSQIHCLLLRSILFL